MTVKCRACRSEADILLDCGPQPFANRYEPTPSERPATWPKRFGFCPRCGLVQALDPADVRLLECAVDWLQFNEPEEHLATLAARLASPLPASASIGGLSAKDASLVSALHQKGARTRWLLTPAMLGLGSRNPGLARIQNAIAAGGAGPLEPVTLLVARHIWEHVHDLPRFAWEVHRLLEDNGRLFVEVPACEPELRAGDYARLWEEHTQHFTETSLANVFRLLGFVPEWVTRAQTKQEEVLLALFRKDAGTPDSALLTGVGPDQALAREYAAGFMPRRRAVQEHVAYFQRTGSIAMLGAGHLGFTFLHLMGIADRVACLFDDNPHKQGLFMGGISAPIRPSAGLAESGASLCLVGVNPTAEAALVGRQEAFLASGGVFASIFPSSCRYIGESFIMNASGGQGSALDPAGGL